MKARSKFLLGGLLVIGTSGVLMGSSVKETAQYFLTPSELATKINGDPTFVEVGVKVGATVVLGTIERAADGRSVRFEMTDSTTTYQVLYKGVIPDTFTDGVDVVVEGRLDEEGTFQATTLLAKCASRYENEPDKYPQSPSYPTGTKPAA